MEINITNTGLTEEEVKEWVSVLVERKINQKISPPAEVIKKAKTDIDAFRTANSLTAKFKAVVNEQ